MQRQRTLRDRNATARRNAAARRNEGRARQDLDSDAPLTDRGIRSVAPRRVHPAPCNAPVEPPHEPSIKPACNAFLKLPTSPIKLSTAQRMLRPFMSAASLASLVLPPPSPAARLPRPPLASLIRRLPSSFAACLPRPPPASIVRRLPQSSAAFTSARTSPTTLNLTHRRVQPMGDAACSPGMTRHAALGRCGMRLRNDAACSPGTPRHANLGRHDMQPRDDAACNSGTTRRAALG